MKFIALVVLAISPALFAQSVADPDPCDWACPSHDGNGKSLIVPHSEFPPFTSPYSIFHCTYVPRGRPCRYYKTSGEFALGGAAEDCPASAVQACTAGDPQEVRPQNTEVMPWIERGGHLMWFLMHPVPKP